MKRASPEYQLQCAVVDHLRLRAKPKVYWTAIPMGEKRDTVTGARIKRMGGRAGAPDLFFIVDGVPYGLELKAGSKARSTAAQIATADDWRAAGGVYRVAHDIDEVLAILSGWKILRRGISADLLSEAEQAYAMTEGV